MESIIKWLKESFIIVLIILQVLALSIKKWVDKRNKELAKKRWKEYSRRLGLTIKYSAEKNGQPYLNPRIGDHNVYLMEWPISGGLKQGIALIIGFASKRIDEKFSLQKKIVFPYKKHRYRTQGFNRTVLEEQYSILSVSEAVSRRLLSSRVITHILSLKPESIFFLKQDDIRAALPSEAIEGNFFLIITIIIPEDFKKINELIELGRVIVKTIDSI